MTEVEIESFDGVRIRSYHSLLTVSQDYLVIALPLATKPSFIEQAVNSLARQYNVITWESRLILEPQVKLPGRKALAIESHVKDVNVILDYFGITQAFLIGYCSGAAAALHIIASDDGRFRRLALINGAYFMKPDECELTQYERDILAVVPQIAADHGQASYVFSRFFEGNSSFRRREHEFAEEIYRPYDNLDSFYRFGVGLKNFIRSDLKRIAREIAVPTLVASGRLDDQTHYSSSMLVASHIAASETYFDEGGDHYELCRAKPCLIGRVTKFLANG